MRYCQGLPVAPVRNPMNHSLLISGRKRDHGSCYCWFRLQRWHSGKAWCFACLSSCCRLLNLLTPFPGRTSGSLGISRHSACLTKVTLPMLHSCLKTSAGVRPRTIVRETTVVVRRVSTISRIRTAFTTRAMRWRSWVSSSRLLSNTNRFFKSIPTMKTHYTIATCCRTCWSSSRIPRTANRVIRKIRRKLVVVSNNRRDRASPTMPGRKAKLGTRVRKGSRVSRPYATKPARMKKTSRRCNRNSNAPRRKLCSKPQKRTNRKA